MELFTTTLGRWRLLKERNIELIDTTVKSGELAFAPEWAWVQGHKAGALSDGEYTELYYEKMRDSYKRRREVWDRLLLTTHPVAIGCYCSALPGTFCHRHLLKGILESICTSRQIPFLYYGEFQ